MISFETQSPLSVNPSLKNQSGVWLYHTSTCPLTEILLSRQKSKISLALAILTTGFVSLPEAMVAA